MKEFTVTTPCKLKDFTDSTYPQGSFYFNVLLKGGDIRVNGAKVTTNVALGAGDAVRYYTTAKMEAKKSHERVFEDENIYVADKYSGVNTEALACELGLFAAHRLDRNTSGLIVFAKTENCRDALEKIFKDRAVYKAYLCITVNNFSSDRADLRAFLKKDEKRSTVVVSDVQGRGFSPIRTEYEVLSATGDLALVKVILHTGKTHQIRAHMAHIGCPLLGDEKYGNEALNAAYGVKRQLLVSKWLCFSLDGRKYSFESSFSPQFPQKNK